MAYHHHLAASCYCHPTHVPCYHHHPPPAPDPHMLHPPHLSHLCSSLSHPPNLPQHFQETYIQEQSQPHPTVSLLLRRISALESALRRRSSSSHSLRDAAARSIQAHFRAFLVRRSVTLRRLKDLASIKSSLGFLKSSVSQKPRFDYDAVYHKAINLLLKLDAIQGGDPMIRNGKSSLKRELHKFLDLIEDSCVQRRIIGVSVKQSDDNVRSRVSNSVKKVGSAESGCSKKVNVEKLRDLVERIDRLAGKLDGEQCKEISEPKHASVMRNPSNGCLLKQQSGGACSKVKKNVSFAEKEKVYRVLRRNSEPYLEECSNGSSTDKVDLDEEHDDEDDELELADDLCRELEEIRVSEKEDVEEGVEDGSSSSDGEKGSMTSRGSFGTKPNHDANGDPVFSAPLPAKMERRSS